MNKVEPVFFFHLCSTFLRPVSWLYKELNASVPVGLCLFVQLHFKYSLQARTALHVPPGDCIVLHLVILRFFTKMQCGVLSIRKGFVCLIRLTQAKSNYPSKDFCFLHGWCKMNAEPRFLHPHLILRPLRQNYSLNRRVTALQFLVELSRHYKGPAGHHCG